MKDDHLLLARLKLHCFDFILLTRLERLCCTSLFLRVAVAELSSRSLDSTRLLFDLQRGNEIGRSLIGQLEPKAIANLVTNGLVEKFGCAFARIWLVEPDGAALRMVASSGVYTRTDGSFGRVPMGAFKIGKIAQNRIPFLSNHLAEESWVKDREWAIREHICGFAGYPLAVGEKVVGVLATFSHQPMEPEFLEVLQLLCTSVTVALENALIHQQEKQSWQTNSISPTNINPLSEQLADLLENTRLILVGTERPLTTPLTYVLLRATEVLRMNCTYCRLTYGAEQISLEAIVSSPSLTPQELGYWTVSALGELSFAVSCLGGTLQTPTEVNQNVVQILLQVPYPSCALGPRLRISCSLPVLQMAFTHLAYLAGLTVYSTTDAAIPLLTDDVAQAQTSNLVVWVKNHQSAITTGVKAKIDLSITPPQFREAVEVVTRGESWGIEPEPKANHHLSVREQEIMALLTQGLRDRDIASKLFISERTVKFHINNTVTKLKARTRTQALHQAILNGWI